MKLHNLAAAVLLVTSTLGPVLTVSPVAADSGTELIQSSGTASLVSRPDGPEGGVQSPEFAQNPDDARADAPQGSEVQLRQGAGPSTGSMVGTGTQVSANDEGGSDSNTKLSFNGLFFRQQRLANGGNQFSVEPPDQGMCVGNGFVLESTNDVLRIFDTAGNPLTGVVDLNTFYGYPAQFNRTTGVQGPFVTDPSCWFDPPTQRWFHSVLTLEVFPDTGDFKGPNHLDLAVSQTANPTGAWTIFRLPVQDDGTQGTPNHGCPAGGPPRVGHHAPTNPNACIGDFPHLGADKFGFYLTSNEYCLFCAGLGFHGAQVYAFNKQALASDATTVAVSRIDTAGAQSGKPGFTLWPATSPTARDFELRAGGTEFFTSSNAAEEVSGVPNANGTNKSNQIVVWALTNTSSLTTATPSLKLRNTTVRVDQYTVPPRSNQKPGNFPLGQCINDTTTPTIFGTIGCWTAIFGAEPKHNEVEGQLDSSDSRVLSTTFAGRKLFGTLDTGLSVGGQTKAGVLFYVITPDLEDEGGGGVSAELERQGHIAVARNNVIYGAVAATHAGRAVVTFTLVGDTHFPSAGYVSLSSGEDRSPITIAAEGLGPQDGFTEYKVFAADGVHPRPRWGDYGAAVATDAHTIWMANEFIAQTCTLAQYMSAPFGACVASGSGTRGTLGNWATRVTEVHVSGSEGDDDSHND